jgi:4-amino-4-deoxy-L-arabinose transferase-like glycosyltransferase
MGLIKNWPWVILTVFFFGVVIALIPRGFYDLGGDSAQYIILGESLAQGSGFHMVNFPGEPFCFYYPPVFPLILSLFITFFGRNLFLMHLAVASLGYAGLWIFYLLFQRYADKKTAFLSVVLLAVNPAVAEYSAGYILSDIPYLFFSGITLLAASFYAKTEKNFLSGSGFLLICGSILAYFSRYAGITLFFGVIAALFFLEKKARFKKIIFFAGAFILFFLSWQIFKAGHYSAFAPHIKQLFLVDPYAPYKGDLFSFPLYFVFHFVTVLPVLPVGPTIDQGEYNLHAVKVLV